MAKRKKSEDPQTQINDSLKVEEMRELLGYLNFRSGHLEASFFKQVNDLWKILPSNEAKSSSLKTNLLAALEQLHQNDEAFSNIDQARRVLVVGVDEVLPKYREFHRDLLFHLAEDDLENPFFLCKILEAVLISSNGKRANVADAAVNYLNDFVGYRPIAVLENGRKMEVYPHERHRPLPLYIPGAGVAAGPYEELLRHTFQFLDSAPQSLLEDAYFSADQLRELACDLRAYDHLHPVFKRTNYTFGEWDPHCIDTKGQYTRFVIRRIVLDSLLDWVTEKGSKKDREEALFDAAAALCGTMLMASSISGANPQSHDSTVSLTTLLPIVARRRDEFYERVMANVSGARAKRLHEEAQKTQQPFGHVRQFLNMKLAGYGARQVQHRELAHLYAAMGYAEASRIQANAIPACSIRIETEIECTVTSVHQSLDSGDVKSAVELAKQIPGLLQRGVNCGGLVDPWNILGFQGQFPLFSAREDAIPDSRVETLLGLMESTFNVFSRTLGEVGAKGLTSRVEEFTVIYEGLADWWDRFASDVIDDLPDVDGRESWQSATHVSEIMNEWRQAGESAGDISFWRQRVDKFSSAQSYALVVDALVEKKDDVAAMGLMMQWLSQLEEVGYECPQHSIFSLLIRWMKLVARGVQESGLEHRANSIRRMFAFLEANADEWWGVPVLGNGIHDLTEGEIASEFLFSDEFENDGDFDEDDSESDIFGAAYDDMVFRDSAEDGNWGDTVENDFGLSSGEFEAINREFEPRLKFLNAVGQLWQMAAAYLAEGLHHQDQNQVLTQELVDAIISWHRQSQRWQIDLAELMENIWDRETLDPSGDHDENVEYDIQLQVKYYLLNQVIHTLICLQNAERLLNSIIPEDVAIPRGTEHDRRLAKVYRAIVQRDREQVSELLPPLLARLSRNPILYVPFEHGGDPGQILRTQAIQSVIRFLLRELPQMGMLRESWHLLYTAFKMERKWRPKGQAITEFDRLFTVSLKQTLAALVESVQSWSEEIDTEDLIDAISKVLDHYQWLWSEHSRTMRISAVDGLRKEGEWEELTQFIQRYGEDLFHASQLTLGNVRVILHKGVDWFLDYLEEEEDPIHPIKLLDDIDSGMIDRDDAEWALEQVYSIVVDRFDRFLEYNTTTTQSDYGNMIHCLLEFLRLEAHYDRDAWNLIPLTLVHEVLVRHQLLDAAEVWEATFEMQTADLADSHLRDLRRLQRRYGMRMPTITDHLKERFVKPLAVNRMLSLVKQSVEDAREGIFESGSFEILFDEVDDYLDDSWGSGIDVPDWLRALEREVSEASHPNEGGGPSTEADFDVPPLVLSKSEFQSQVLHWKDSLGKRNRMRSPKNGSDAPSTESNSAERDSSDED